MTIESDSKRYIRVQVSAEIADKANAAWPPSDTATVAARDKKWVEEFIQPALDQVNFDKVTA